MKIFKNTDDAGVKSLNNIKRSLSEPTADGDGATVTSLESRRDSARSSRSPLHLINEIIVDREEPSENLPDLVCLSHLRWDFVYQRPQHLLTRFAREGRRVFFVEEPVYDAGSMRLEVRERESGVRVVVPHLPEGLVSSVATDAVQQGLIDRLFEEHNIREHILWYYTPMAISFTHHLRPQAVIYDCMDELSAFKGAPQALRFRETELFRRADLVFTGGQSLYEAKRQQHPQHRHIHAFPSSIDAQHFAQARTLKTEPADQAAIPHPRIGFFGVIDERLDIELLRGVADARPDWQLVMIGPVVKIDEADLPRRDNIRYLGGKAYKDLPAYLAGWDVALLPFARNESTRFISPTKTPEYLAAGRPVVSTSIRDVVRPYGEMELVRIADTVEDFVQAVEASLTVDNGWQRRVDAFLAQNSWDLTWGRMSGLIEDVISARRGNARAARATTAGARVGA
ncbi:MAG: UDP-galactopyranose mutase [Blastocatellia bacterium]|jgi:UDP-galactopyranose mutase|nr:UDP-galactopyranose mutase [Blastocatellia bacterium]